MRKIFYDKVNNIHVEDITGQKILADIEEQFGLKDGNGDNISVFQVLEVDDTVNGYELDNGTGDLVTYSLATRKSEQDTAEANYQATLTTKQDALKTKLGLTDEEMEDLKEIVRKIV